MHFSTTNNNLINNAIVTSLLGGEPAVAVAVSFNSFDFLACVFCYTFLKHFFGVGHLFSLDGYIRDLSANTT